MRSLLALALASLAMAADPVDQQIVNQVTQADRIEVEQQKAALAEEVGRMVSGTATSLVPPGRKPAGSYKEISDIPADIVSYRELMEGLTSGRWRRCVAVFCGDHKSRVVRMLKGGMIKTYGIPVAVVSAYDEVLNPFTGTKINGRRFWNLYGAAAGSVIILDRDGIPIPFANIPFLTHANDPKIIDPHFAYFGSDSDLSMRFDRFIAAVGVQKRFSQSQARLSNGFLGRYLTPVQTPLVGKTDDGETWDPWKKPGCIHLVASSISGRSFKTQLDNLIKAVPSMNAALTVMIPPGEDLTPLLQDVKFPINVVRVPKNIILASGPSPRILVTDRMPPEGSGKGIELWGYLPIQLLAAKLGMPMVPTDQANVDVPIGDTDEGDLPEVDELNPRNSLEALLGK